jgi:hypothetical protein
VPPPAQNAKSVKLKLPPFYKVSGKLERGPLQHYKKTLKNGYRFSAYASIEKISSCSVALSMFFPLQVRGGGACPLNMALLIPPFPQRG